MDIMRIEDSAVDPSRRDEPGGSVLVRRPSAEDGQTALHSWQGLQVPGRRGVVRLSAWEAVLRAVSTGSFEIALLELDPGADARIAAGHVRTIRRADANLHVIVVADQADAVRAAKEAGAIEAVGTADATRIVAESLVRLAHERASMSQQLAEVARARRMDGMSGSVLGELPHAVFAVTSEGDIAFANRAAAELVQTPQSSLASRTFPALIDEDHRWRVGHALDRNRGGHRVYGVECRLRGPAGNSTWVHLDFSPWREGDPGRRGSLVVGRVLTERRQFDSERGDTSMPNVDAMLDTIPIGIVVADGEGRARLINRTARELLGGHAWTPLARWETLGLFRGPDGMPAKPHELPFSRTLRDGLPRREVELEIDLPGAQGVPVLVNTDATRDAQGSVSEVVVTFTNVSERRRVEGQLIQAQKMESLGLLAGTVAHDFKNVLCAVLGYAELLVHRLDADSPMARFASEIHKAGEQGAALARQLMVFTREDGFEPVALDPAASFRDCLGVIERMVPEDIELAVDIAQDAGCIRGDANRLWQVLMNLVLNARDAMPRGGRIGIHLQRTAVAERVQDGPRPGDYACLEVTDNGTGMPDSVRQRIFEPFFTTKQAGAGTGLGLSVVRSVLRQHKATIAVDSEPGSGTTFRIWFPLIKEVAQEVSAPRRFDTPVTENERGVLLAEDDPMVRAVLREVLEVSGCRVIEAGSAEEALRKAEVAEFEIQALITDVVMPGMHGRELAERLRVRNPNLRVLYLSGYTDEALRRYGVHTKEVPFLHKPFKPSTLSRQIHDLFLENELSTNAEVLGA